MVWRSEGDCRYRVVDFVLVDDGALVSESVDARERNRFGQEPEF